MEELGTFSVARKAPAAARRVPFVEPASPRASGRGIGFLHSTLVRDAVVGIVAAALVAGGGAGVTLLANRHPAGYPNRHPGNLRSGIGPGGAWSHNRKGGLGTHVGRGSGVKLPVTGGGSGSGTGPQTAKFSASGNVTVTGLDLPPMIGGLLSSSGRGGSGSGNSITVSATASGAVDLASKALQVKANISGVIGSLVGTIQVVSVGGNVYVNIPIVGSLSSGKPWVSAAVPAGIASRLPDLSTFYFAAPGGLSDLLSPYVTGGIKAGGTATVGSNATTVYRAAINVPKVIQDVTSSLQKAASKSGRKLPVTASQISAVLKGLSIEVDSYVDNSDGLVRQVTVNASDTLPSLSTIFSTATGGSGGETTSTTCPLPPIKLPSTPITIKVTGTVTFSGFGSTVNITAPPASQTESLNGLLKNLSSLLGNMGGLGGIPGGGEKSGSSGSDSGSATGLSGILNGVSGGGSSGSPAGPPTSIPCITGGGSGSGGSGGCGCGGGSGSSGSGNSGGGLSGILNGICGGGGIGSGGSGSGGLGSSGSGGSGGFGSGGWPGGLL